MYSDKENVNILTAMLVELGVRHVVVCPGSRNAPLVHNFNECPDLECHLVTDERSAAFVALGISTHQRTPVVVCVTSGSALLNTLPGVAEATYQHHGIIVVSADRPEAWIGQLDGQTLPQHGALGSFVGKSVTLPEPHDEEGRWYCQRLINEAFLALSSEAHPSVHINVPITEPLFGFNTGKLPAVRIVRRLHWDMEQGNNRFLRLLSQAKRPMIVIGQMADGVIAEDVLDTLSRHFAVLYEPLSGELPPCHTDDMLRAIESAPKKYQPDFILYVGRNTVSKRLRHFMRGLGDKATVVMVNRHGDLEDVTQHTSYILVGREEFVLGELSACINPRARQSAFSKLWDDLRLQVAQNVQETALDYSAELAVKLFEQERDECDIVCYANSSAVRLASRYAEHYCHCNRGLNGIEGSLSTAVGMSLVAEEKVYCVIGDLSFFYDQNALWQPLKSNMRILLLNNGGGAIFRTLPGLENSPARDTLVSAPHTTSAQGICQQFNVQYQKAEDCLSLEKGIQWLTKRNSNAPMLLEVCLKEINE